MLARSQLLKRWSRIAPGSMPLAMLECPLLVRKAVQQRSSKPGNRPEHFRRQQRRTITVEPLSGSRSKDGMSKQSRRTTDGAPVQRSNTAGLQLRDLADDVVETLQTTRSAVLSGWADRIRRLMADKDTGSRLGVIYSESNSDIAKSTVRDGLDISFMSVSEANTSRDAFVDWIYSFDSIVLVVGREKIVRTLAESSPLHTVLQIHPDVVIAVDGLASDPAVVSPFSDLLQETLAALGLLRHPCTVVSGTGIQSVYKNNPRSDIRDMILASALESSIRCVEHGGKDTLVPVARPVKAVSFKAAPLPALADRTFRNLEESVSSASKRIQLDFEGGDLATIDASAGAIKQRIETWFSSGKVWKTLMMRVYEVSDDLIDNAILDRSFEAADLGMVHAAGRLNESIRSIANDLASEIESVFESLSDDVYTDPALTKSAVNALRAIASQKDPVDPFVLARHVWDVRKQMIESSILENVPRYAHWSLSQFWAIHASAVAGTTASIMYLDAPLQYAATGGLGVSLLAFVWLGRRWVQLQRSLYSDIDTRANDLRGTLLDAHKRVLEARLGKPILECIRKVSRSDTVPTLDDIVQPQDTSQNPEIPVSEWRLRLESASRLWR